MRILVTQTAGLGDCLRALPALRTLRDSFPDAAIDFFVPAPYRGLLGPISHDWRVSLVEDIADRYDGSLHLDARPKEGVDDLELARELVGSLGGTFRVPTAIELPSDPEAKYEADETLASLGLLDKPFVVFHPGGNPRFSPALPLYRAMGDLLGVLSEDTVVLSVGPDARDWSPVEAVLRDRSYRVLSNLELPAFAEVLRRARLVIAPPTGVLHLAHYVGTTTFGLFASPEPQGSSQRWSPWGGSGRVLTMPAPFFSDPSEPKKMLNEFIQRWPLATGGLESSATIDRG